MTATREDMLAELALMPLWQRRAVPAAAVAAPEASPTIAGNEPRHARIGRIEWRGFGGGGAPGASPTIAGNEPRHARIARIEWRDFAADVDACTACGLCRTRHKSVP